MTTFNVIARRAEQTAKQSHNWNSKVADCFISLRYIRNDETHCHSKDADSRFRENDSCDVTRFNKNDVYKLHF